MKLTEFDYEVFAMVRINGHELGRLSTLSQKHYDGHCKAAGQLGGFLYGFIQQWITASEGSYAPLEETAPADLERETIIRMSGHQLDTLAKICEQDDSDLWTFVSILRRCVTEYERLRGDEPCLVEK